MSPTDTTNFTAITAAYDSLDIHLRTGSKWKEFKKLRPSDDVVNDYFEKAVAFWDSLITSFPALQEMRDSHPDEKVAAAHRGGHGGHLLFRPVGLLLVVRVIRRLTESGIDLPEAIEVVSRAPVDIAQDPWAGLLWDPTNRRMITTREHKRAAERLLVYLVGGDLAPLKSSPDGLRSELAGLLNRPPEEFALPAQIR